MSLTYLFEDLFMKLTKVAAALAAVAAIGFVATASANSINSDGSLTFSGQVLASTCQINAGGSGGTNYNVILPDVQASALANPSDSAGTSAPFDIVLSGESCADGSTWAMHFEPTAATVDPATGALINQAIDGAQNVQVQLLDNKFATVNAATNENPQTVVINGNTGTLTYSARYFTPEGNATAGEVSASVEYSVVQN
jgi:major type 1 subunit fimbrin (pilin)